MEEDLDGKVTQNQQKGIYLFVCLLLPFFFPFSVAVAVVVVVAVVIFSLGAEIPSKPQNPSLSHIPPK